MVSADGGQNWELTAGAGGANCTVSFADDETGWVLVDDRTLQETSDGGATWTGIPLPADVSDVSAIALRAAGTGYLLTPDAVLYTTQDGGASWSSVALDLSNHEGMSIILTDLPPAGIHFSDANNGTIALSLIGGGKSALVVLRTTDGGETWKDTVVLTHDTGIVYLTRDGRFLTLTSFLKNNHVTVLEYKGN